MTFIIEQNTILCLRLNFLQFSSTVSGMFYIILPVVQNVLVLEDKMSVCCCLC